MDMASNSKSYTGSNDSQSLKNWDLNQVRMNQSLNEFMKNIQRTSERSVVATDANLDITNLAEEESASADKSGSQVLDGSSTTAEFKKYLDELKKNYLEKLTFSCPSKPSRSALRSVENRELSSYGALANSNVNTRRSLYFDNKPEDVEERPVAHLPTAFRSDTLGKQLASDTTAGSQPKQLDRINEIPELSKGQILSRLVQIREYLKQSYTMLSTLQDSNDLINYSTQMSKLHSLIDHLKEQEKGYMDLLRTFSKFQSISSNFYSSSEQEPNGNNSSLSLAAYQRDVLDLSELNESLANQQKEQKQQQSEMLASHANYLSSLLVGARSPSADKAVQVSARSEAATAADCLETATEGSCHSISGSFISDTLTLNGVKCDMKGLVKYSKNEANMAGLVGDKTDQTDTENEQAEDNKTEADLTEDEYTYDVNPGEIFSKFVAPTAAATSIKTLQAPNQLDEDQARERYQGQRKEIYDALDGDLVTLEQLKEQKSLLKSIRLRKEELKALEGRRVALEALRKIANQSEAQLDGQSGLRSSSSCGAFESMSQCPSSSGAAKVASFVEETDGENATTENKLKQVSDLCRFLDMLKEKQEERVGNDTSADGCRQTQTQGTKQSLARKTFKQPAQTSVEAYSNPDHEDGDEGELNVQEAAVEASSQIEKSKQTVKHFEALIRNKSKAASEAFLASNLLKPSISGMTTPNVASSGFATPAVDGDADNSNDRQAETEEENQEQILKELSVNQAIDAELSFKMASLAENEKKLEELYSMQSRLSQLKSLISDFNESKDEQAAGKDVKRIRESTDLLTNDYRNSLLALEAPSSGQPMAAASTTSAGDEAARLRMEYEQIRQEFEEKYDGDANDGLEGEEGVSREDVLNEQLKLTDAKGKLKQLQGIIAKLKGVSSRTELTSRQQSELEQKEAAAALQVLNDIEKQKQQQRLEDLKRNKLKLLELLRQKEMESAELAKLCSSYSAGDKHKQLPEPRDLADSDGFEDKQQQQQEAAEREAEEAAIEDKFATAENDLFESGAEDFERACQHNSPSDLLWSQMKRQLNMRENLRSKKQELEELIRDENCRAAVAATATAIPAGSSANSRREMEEENKLVSCYRGMLLKNKRNHEEQTASATAVLGEQSNEDVEDEEEIIMKRYVPAAGTSTGALNETVSRKQQGNVCSADELIEGCEVDLAEEDFGRTDGGDREQNKQVFAKYEEPSGGVAEGHLKQKGCDSSSRGTLDAFAEHVSGKFGELVESQRQLNECVQKSLADLSKVQRCGTTQQQQPSGLLSNGAGATAAGQLEMSANFQVQLQLQQMMLNMTAMLNEMSSQRIGMGHFKEQLNSIETKVGDLVQSNNHLLDPPKLHSTHTQQQQQQQQFQANKRCKKLTRYTPPNINYPTGDNDDPFRTYQSRESSDLMRPSSSLVTTNALPTYFYKRQQQPTNSSYTTHAKYSGQYSKKASSGTAPATHNDYEDDFEDCDSDATVDKTLKASSASTAAATTSYQATRYQTLKKPRPTMTMTTAATTTETATDSSSRSSACLSKRTSTASSGQFHVFDRQEDTPCGTPGQGSVSVASRSGCGTGEIFNFEQMREKIYSEVATLISQNETRPFYLINLFKELQFIKEKNARDQVLKSVFNIANRQPGVGASASDSDARSESKVSSASQTASDMDARAHKSCANVVKPNVEVWRCPEGDGDGDDSVTCQYRLKKFKAMNMSAKGLQRERLSRSSGAEAEESGFGADGRSTSRSHSPTENDSLSNTVIFVKGSPLGKHEPLTSLYAKQKQSQSQQQTQISPKRGAEDFSRSSSSSILGVQETFLSSYKKSRMQQQQQPKKKEDFFLEESEEQQQQQAVFDQKKIELEVNSLISKIIRMIKTPEDHEDDEDSFGDEEQHQKRDSDDEPLEDLESVASSVATDKSAGFRTAKCDSDYLNEIIGKVVTALRQSEQGDHTAYLAAYEGQLSAYLREALVKYEDRRLVACLEDILIDISDILYNELTFYAIMSSSHVLRPALQSSGPATASRLSSSGGHNLNLIRSLANPDSLKRTNSALDAKKQLIDNKLAQLKHEFEFIRNQSIKNFNNSLQKSIRAGTLSATATEPTTTATTTAATSRSTSLSSALTDDARDAEQSCGEQSSAASAVYYFDENDVKQRLDVGSSFSRRQKSAQIESNYADILGRLKLILNEKTAELNSMMQLSDALKAKSQQQQQQQTQSEFHTIDSQDEDVVFHSPKERDDSSVNEFKLRLLKYSTVGEGSSSQHVTNQPHDGDTDTDAYTDADSDTNEASEVAAKCRQEQASQKVQSLDEITIDDLPAKMSLIMGQIEASTAELNVGTQILDQIIMDSVSEGLVGDADEFPVTAFETNGHAEKENEIEGENEDEETDKQIESSPTGINKSSNDEEPNSESSTSSSSEQFVMLSSGSYSGNSSDQVMVDSPPKKQTSPVSEAPASVDEGAAAVATETDTTLTEGCISPSEVIV